MVGRIDDQWQKDFCKGSLSYSAGQAAKEAGPVKGSRSVMEFVPTRRHIGRVIMVGEQSSSRRGKPHVTISWKLSGKGFIAETFTLGVLCVETLRTWPHFESIFQRAFQERS